MTDGREQGTGVRVELAVVRSLDAPRRVETTQEREDFEQELVDQYLLAAVGSGASDGTVNENRSVIFEFARFLARPVWTAQPQDADRFLARQRIVLGRARLTVQHKGWALARFYDFLVLRYQGDVQRLTGHVVIQVIDEFNRPAKADYGVLRVRRPKMRWRRCSRRGGTGCPMRASFCASSMYARGMDLKAIQELLGHEWLSTTTGYIHVHADHIEHAWANANARVAARLGEGTR